MFGVKAQGRRVWSEGSGKACLEGRLREGVFGVKAQGRHVWSEGSGKACLE